MTLANNSTNILFITVDQLRYDSLGCTGHPMVKTPNIDKLAADGVVLDSAFVQSAVCAPSRACMYTGRYMHNHRVRFNEVPFGAGEKTIADYFHEHGYRASLIGRTHFTPITETYGFEYFMYYDGLPAKDAYSPYIDYLRKSGYSDEDIKFRYWPKELTPLPGQEAYPEDFREAFYPSRIKAEHSDTAYMTDEAIRFINETGSKPWMLHLSYWKPHLPFSVPEPYHSMYDPADVPMPELKPGELDSKPPLQKLFRDERRGHYLKDEKLLRQIRAVYYGMITEIDDHLGRLFKEMEILGLFDNTLIIFTSDHGEYLGDHGMIEKELFYEQAIKVPMIMHWPRHIRPNTHIHEFVESIDILPTCMEAAGIPIPDALEGFSLFPLIRGEAVNWRQEVYAEWDYRYYHVRNKLELQPHQCRAVMIRDRKWKYIHYTDQPCELYDLENDPDEFFNLANDPRHFETAINLKERILNWRLRTEDSKPDADLTFATYLRNPWEGGTNN